MLQLQNNTPLSANISVLPNEQGIDTLFVIARARFQLGKQWTLHEEQLPPTEADEYYGEPGQSSIKRPSEYHLGKLATDIIMIGDVIAPNGQEVRALDVSLQVENVIKQARVFGDRVWQNGMPSQPIAFKRIPLNFERAYGGTCIDEQGLPLSAEERNPVGLGYLGEYSEKDFEQLAVPNIEDPTNLIQTIGDKPQPVGFGTICPNWKPRVDFAGTYDDAWTETRAPYLPLDFDKRFFSCAHPNLIYPGYLKGGEQVYIRGMHENGTLSFNLPKVNLLARVYMANQVVPLTFNMETLLLEPNDLVVDFTWRASALIGKRVLQVSAVELVLTRLPEVA